MKAKSSQRWLLLARYPDERLLAHDHPADRCEHWSLEAVFTASPITDSPIWGAHPIGDRGLAGIDADSHRERQRTVTRFRSSPAGNEPCLSAAPQ